MNSPIAGLRLAGRMMFDGNSNAAPAPENGRGGQLKWGRPDEPLNAKHRAFVNEYLKDGNASRAAVAAGYSPNRGKETGCELLQNPRIAAAVMARSDELAANLQAARAQVVAANQDVADRAEAAADEIAEELQGLSGKARGLMTLAEGAGDLKTALAGLREISRLLELKAKLAGRIAGAQIQINLAKIDVAMLSDADLQAFLERARDRVARIQQRQLDNVISDEDTARVLQAEVVRTLSSAVGWPVTIEMAVEALKAARAEDVERPESVPAAIETPAPSVAPRPEAPTPPAEPMAVAAIPAPVFTPAPAIDIRDRLLARLDDRRRW